MAVLVDAGARRKGFAEDVVKMAQKVPSSVYTPGVQFQVSAVCSPRTRRLNTRMEMRKRRKYQEKKHRASLGVQKENAEEYLRISRNWV